MGATKQRLIACSVTAVIALIVGNPEYSDLRTSKDGLAVIGNKEGCVRNPYKCPADFLTVGIGTTESIAPIRVGKIYSDDEIALLWYKGLKVTEACVSRTFPSDKFTQGEWDAIVSFTYNVGCGAMQKSTFASIIFNTGDVKYACRTQLPKWIYAGGVKSNGLIDRRKEEVALCLQ